MDDDSDMDDSDDSDKEMENNKHKKRNKALNNKKNCVQTSKKMIKNQKAKEFFKDM